MSIPIDTECLQCMLRRNIELARSLGTEEQAVAFARRLMRLYLDAPEGVSSPWFGPQIADLLHELYGLPIDRFRQEKLDSNRFVLERLPQIRQKVASAADPVLAGLQFAILGNYLDFSALQGQVSFEKLEEMLDKALEMELDEQVYGALCRDLERGGRLLYLTDNAGEIGFDRVLAETIAERYPNLAITFCVRGAVTQNDATREDAAAVGLPFPVIDNGNRVAGTQLDQLSDEAAQALREADVILAKGMANVETMSGCGYNVYYAFLVKCQRFVRLFGKSMLTPMLVRERQ
ncbi:MAG: ARMT1-like domain-containing protein [Firmicutes bacterium]|nr:ARMT1-like domain-containing protein [Bacillota bacterium]